MSSVGAIDGTSTGGLYLILKALQKVSVGMNTGRHLVSPCMVLKNSHVIIPKVGNPTPCNVDTMFSPKLDHTSFLIYYLRDG